MFTVIPNQGSQMPRPEQPTDRRDREPLRALGRQLLDQWEICSKARSPCEVRRRAFENLVLHLQPPSITPQFRQLGLVVKAPQLLLMRRPQSG